MRFFNIPLVRKFGVIFLFGKVTCRSSSRHIVCWNRLANFWFLLSFYRNKSSFLFWFLSPRKVWKQVGGKRNQSSFLEVGAGVHEWGCIESNSVRFMMPNSNSITQMIFLFVLKVKKKPTNVFVLEPLLFKISVTFNILHFPVFLRIVHRRNTIESYGC